MGRKALGQEAVNLRSIPQKLRVRQKLYHLWLPLGLRRNGRRCGSDRIVAGMATMPTREKTFRPAFQSIIRQVDHLYLYLDGFETIPDIVKDHPRVTATLARQEEGLHANGKFLGLVYEQQPCLYVSVDDDIYYPHNFVARLRARLAAAVRGRDASLQHTAGLNEEVFDALVLLSAGSFDPADLRRGHARVVELRGEMDRGRRRRLVRLGFSDGDAAELSSLHTQNFM